MEFLWKYQREAQALNQIKKIRRIKQDCVIELKDISRKYEKPQELTIFIAILFTIFFKIMLLIIDTFQEIKGKKIGEYQK